MARRKQVTATDVVEHLHVLARLLQGHAGGAGALTGLGEGHLGPLEGVQEPRRVAHPPARPGQPLEVFGPERLLGVGIEQPRPSRGPVVAPVGRTCVV